MVGLAAPEILFKPAARNHGDAFAPTWLLEQVRRTPGTISSDTVPTAAPVPDVTGSANRKQRACDSQLNLADTKPAALACAASLADFRQSLRSR